MKVTGWARISSPYAVKEQQVQRGTKVPRDTLRERDTWLRFNTDSLVLHILQSDEQTRQHCSC